MYKILFITTSFEQKANSAAIRNNALVKGLIQNKCKVTVLTPQWPEHMSSLFFKGQNRADIIRTYIPDLAILKKTSASGKRISNSTLSHIRGLVRDLVYYPDICKNWADLVKIENIDSYDLIISSSDLKSSHFVALKLKKQNPQIPWIQIWGDPWKEDVNLSWLHKHKAGKHEYELLKQADKVIYVSSPTKEKMSRNYPELSDKLFYIPRGYYQAIHKIKVDKNLFRVIYTGVLSTGRNVFNLLSILEEYNKEREKKIYLDFYGNYPSDIAEKIKTFPSCSVHPNIDYEKILSLYKESDALLFISNKQGSTQIPGKFFDYMGTELPMICLVEDTNNGIVQMLHSYPRCLIMQNRPEEIRKGLADIDNYLGKRYEVEQDFSPETVASEVLRLMV